MAARRGFYLAALAGCGIFYIAYGQWLSWLLLLTALALPWFSLLLSLPALLTFRAGPEGPAVLDMGAGGELWVVGRCTMPMPLFQGRIRLSHCITGESWYYADRADLLTAHCGGLTVTLDGLRVYDYLGLFSFRLRCRERRTLLIRPRPVPMKLNADLERIVPRAWKPKPGGGFGENHELRLYRPGDSLNQIHWKLTAKTGSLMIRQAMEPQEGLILLTMNLRGSNEELDRKFGRLLWLGNRLLRFGLPFDLPLAHGKQLVLVCGAAALLSAGILSLRWGNPTLACLMALAAGYVWQDGTAWEQTRVLLHQLTSVYSRAYGWSVAALPEGLDAVTVDWPLAILGCLITITVCNSICCRLSAVLPVVVTVLVLSLCVVVTDTVPEEKWLLAVMAGLALLILTAAVRRENPWQGLRLTALAAAPVMLALTALFLLVPQEGYVNQSEVLRENILLAVKKFPQLVETGMTQVANRVQPKTPKQVNLSTLGERIPFTYPVMEITAQKSGSLYLRQQDYDIYDGLVWHADGTRTETFSGTAGEITDLTIRTEKEKAFYYLPYYPAGETVLVAGAAENPRQEQEYTLRQTHLPDDWRQTAYRAGTASDQWQEYCDLPDRTQQEAGELLAGLFSQDASNTEKADIIAALVLESARYDLAPEKMPREEQDFALWFLREADRGYCVHFATAATVLLRAADVPARYVTGYLTDALAGQTVTVTEADAHAWAEYYEPNLGLWLPLEATPAQEEPDTMPMPPATQTPPATTEPEPEIPTTEQSVPETTRPAPSQPVPSAEETMPEVLPSEPEEEEPARWPLLLLLPLLAVVQRWWRLTWRARRFRRGSPNRQALCRWQEAERLSRILKECPPPELQELALKAKFSQYTLTGEELSRFDEHIAEAVRRMRKHPWWCQLIYRFIYAAY